MNKDAQRRRTIKAIRLTWDSLDSHLDYAHIDQQSLCECTHHVSCGNRKFHAQCVKEYAFVIHALADML